MIFALATDEMTLFVFGTEADALGYCEGIDVEDDGWRFWDSAGKALRPEFTTPNKHSWFGSCSGIYRLVSSDQPSLSDAISTIHNIDRNEFFPSISAVKDYISNSSQASQHGA